MGGRGERGKGGGEGGGGGASTKKENYSQLGATGQARPSTISTTKTYQEKEVLDRDLETTKRMIKNMCIYRDRAMNKCLS